MQIVEGVLARNDDSKPDALALKIELLLMRSDLKRAEDVEDILTILYPKHPAALRGARLVYGHYLKQVQNADPDERPRKIETYLKRHPNGLLEKEAEKKLNETRDGIKARYNKSFEESLLLARGYIKQHKFERARNELIKAEETAKVALSKHGFSFDTTRVTDLRLKADKEEGQYQWRQAFRKAKDEASRKAPGEKIKIWIAFLNEYPGTPYTREAKARLEAIKNGLKAKLQQRYDQLLALSESDFSTGPYPRVSENLDAAETLYRQARDELGIELEQKNLIEIRTRYLSKAGEHQHHMAWSRTDAKARTIELNEPEDYQKRIGIYEGFINKWPYNPYRGNAHQEIASLTSEMVDFKNRRFKESFIQAKTQFVEGSYNNAFEFLDMARKYATYEQLKEIEAIARRYNTPP
jgi:hypothetical protein